MKDKITSYQFFILMILLPYGSAVLFYLVPETKQDVWIAMLFYSLVGVFLQLMYLTLYYKYPKDTLVTYLPKIYGKFLGNIFSIVYIAYFTYIASRVLRDFEEIIAQSSLDLTPMIFIGIAFMIIVTYGVSKGLKVIANFAQFSFFVIILMPVFVWMLASLKPDFIKLYNLKPILQDGFIDLIKRGWMLIAFPYGETIAFTMIYPYVSEHNKIRKAAIASIFVESIILSLTHILAITTMGVGYSSSYISSFLLVIRNINIFFLERIDVLFIVILVLGGFFKITILMYTAVLGAAQVLKLKDIKLLAIPFGIIIIILSKVIAGNYSEHIEIGLNFVVKYIHIPLQIIFPALTIFVFYIRQLFNKQT